MSVWIPDARFEMPELLVPGRKPTTGLHVDYSNPLARNLELYMAHVGGYAMQDLAKGRSIEVNGTVFMTPAVHPLLGVCQNINQPDGPLWRQAALARGTDTAPLTVYWEFIPTEVSGASNAVWTWADIGNLNVPFLLVNADTAGNFRAYINGNYRFSWTYAANVLQRGVLSFDGTTTTGYINGASVGTYTSSLGANGGGNVVMGNGFSAGHRGFYGSLAVWMGRALGGSEVADLSMNPYQFLIPS